MDRPRCPGQDMRNWRPEDIFDVACPACSAEIEFWKDEPFRICTSCGMEVQNPRLDFGCAKWCKFAEQCVGAERAAAMVEASMRDRLIAAMKSACAGEEDRIGHALDVLDNAEQLIEGEEADALVIKAAAILHDIDERETTITARDILEKLGIDERASACVCAIIDSLHGGGSVDTFESRIVRDADRLAELEAGGDTTNLSNIFESTKGLELAGKRLARG